MKGYLVEGEEGGSSGRLAPWEAVAVDAVGLVIEFWGFKRNQGRVWALLYLRSTPLSAQQLQDELDLSKGGVSMLTRELETWGVVRRVREPGTEVWKFEAETRLMRMIGRVVREREGGMLARVRADLQRAVELARKDRGTPVAARARLTRMLTLATVVEQAVRLFLDTARIDVGPALEVLTGKRALDDDEEDDDEDDAPRGRRPLGRKR